jgi:hypothetical protein
LRGNIAGCPYHRICTPCPAKRGIRATRRFAGPKRGVRPDAPTNKTFWLVTYYEIIIQSSLDGALCFLVCNYNGGMARVNILNEIQSQDEDLAPN